MRSRVLKKIKKDIAKFKQEEEIKEKKKEELLFKIKKLEKEISTIASKRLKLEYELLSVNLKKQNLSMDDVLRLLENEDILTILSDTLKEETIVENNENSDVIEDIIE